MYSSFPPPSRKSLLSSWYDGQARYPGPLEPDAAGFPDKSSAPSVRLARAGDNKWGPSGLGEQALVLSRKAELLAAPQVTENFDLIVRNITGQSFDQRDASRIKNEILANLPNEQVNLFRNLGPSKDKILRLNPAQWGAVRGMIDGFPRDEPGVEVRRAYGEAVKQGRIRLVPDRGPR